MPTEPEPSAPSAPRTSPHAPWWKGIRGEWYVAVQVVIFGFIALGPRDAPGLPLWSGPLASAADVGGVALVVVGAALAIAGAVALGRNLTALPYPKDDSVLVESGPYRIVRNPIYSGLIIGAFGLALAAHSWLSLLYALALLVLFDVKTRKEERWLLERYPAYAEYRQRVRKLLPWVW